MTAILIVLAVITAIPGLATAVHLGTLALASLFYRERRSDAVAPLRYCTLIPAHNEELVIGATLNAINADKRDGDLVIVVADRCTDATAEIARAHGAVVLERHEGAEPGRAAARQDGLQHALGYDWDALAWIDADSIIEPGFYDACEATLAGGALAVQARSEAAIGPGLVAQATLASFALQGVTIPRGRDRLGLLVRLRGTGMVIMRELAELPHRFRAPASEDLWYSLDLCLAGIRPRHVESARLRSQNAGNWAAAKSQRERYEAGRTSAAKAFIAPLLRRHDAASIEAAAFLATPPFAVAVVSVLLGLGLSLLAGWGPGIAVTATGLAGLTFVLVVGLVQARAGWRTWVALAAAPWYLMWKVPVQIKAMAGTRTEKVYGATPREHVS